MKGSRNAIIKFVESGDFPEVINNVLKTSGAKINSNDNWIPKAQYDKEVQLNVFLKFNSNQKWFNSQKLSSDIVNWWLHKSGRTPNWDFISTCTVHGERGILLVEAKAHIAELQNEHKGKPKLKDDASDGTKKNHEKIALAINEANAGIKNEINEIKLSRDSCYQFSNRVAHAWWLANQGIPVVLLYAGFLNIDDMKDKYKIFKTHEEWKACFIGHAKKAGADTIINKTINCGKSSFTVICESLNSPCTDIKPF